MGSGNTWRVSTWQHDECFRLMQICFLIYWPHKQWMRKISESNTFILQSYLQKSELWTGEQSPYAYIKWKLNYFRTGMCNNLFSVAYIVTKITTQHYYKKYWWFKNKSLSGDAKVLSKTKKSVSFRAAHPSHDRNFSLPRISWTCAFIQSANLDCLPIPSYKSSLLWPFQSRQHR